MSKIKGMKNESLQGEAMKIMEALTGVDEELLARCEEAGSLEAQAGERKRGWNKKRNLYLWRLSSCAALLCLFVIGAVAWREMGKLSTNENSMYMDMSGSAGGISDAGEHIESELEATSDNMPNMVFNEPCEYSQAPAQNAGASGGVNVSPTAASAAEEAALRDLSGKESQDGKEMEAKKDFTVESMEGCLAYPVDELTEAEARQVELFGGYIPTKLPAGYAFSTACWNLEHSSMSLYWHRWMDDIMIYIRKLDGEAPETVDVSKPEYYDERLYEIPYAMTVPEEYWKTFKSPVFAKDDLSLEIVSSRVLSYSGDSEDTSTPRGDFYVLYDKVLVYFNGRGTPEQIWEMFSSIQE